MSENVSCSLTGDKGPKATEMPVAWSRGAHVQGTLGAAAGNPGRTWETAPGTQQALRSQPLHSHPKERGLARRQTVKGQGQPGRGCAAPHSYTEPPAPPLGLKRGPRGRGVSRADVAASGPWKTPTSHQVPMCCMECLPHVSRAFFFFIKKIFTAKECAHSPTDDGTPIHAGRICRRFQPKAI